MRKISFLLLIILKSISKAYSTLKFKITTEPLRERKNEKETFYDISKDNLELIEINIGSPPQKINVSLSYSTFFFYISGSKVINSSYSENNSISFNQISFIDSDFYNDIFYKGFYSTENFIFENKKIFQFPFIIATQILGNYNIIGLNIKKENGKLSPNLIFDLNNKSITKNNLWSVTFNNVSNYKKGEFIIGKEYNSKNLKWSKIELKYLEWVITFDDIFFNEFKIMDFRDCQFKLEFGLIGVPEYFMKYLIKKYVDNINCIKIGNEYDIFSFACNNSFDIKNFPSMKFYSRDFGRNFTFEYKDLFYNYEGLNYCLLSGGKEWKNNWVLGKPFLQNYHFVFDPDKKLIAYNNDDNSFNFDKNIILIIVVFLMFALIICLLFFIKYMVKKTRKIRVNEINDIYEYKMKE